MKKFTYSLSLVFILLSTSILAQKGEVTFNFFGQDAATTNAVALEKVMVKNLTQNCDTTIYGPDPQLILWVSGVNEIKEEDFKIGNNYPNPFSGTTSFDLQLKKPEQIVIRLINTQGTVVADYNDLFQTGTHSVNITTGKSGIFYAEVSTSNTIRTIKLISQTPSSVDNYSISYSSANHNESLKNALQILGFVFQPGDELQITASAETYPDETLTVFPTTDMDFTFDMRPVPIADFVVENESGAFPFTTYFTDMSTRNPTSWSWDFGDGWSSTLQDNTHTFETTGFYTVTLAVGNEYGTDTIVMEDFIQVKDITIVCDTTSGYAPLIVNFNGICNIPDITAWTWDFGDGETSNEQNPSHTYIEPDSYNYVTVSVSSGGNVYSDEITIHVFIDLAEVNFVADITDGWVPQTIQFTSYTNISNPTAYNWSFGDGNFSYDVNPTHTYDNIGTYTVGLQVANNNGFKTESKEDYITIRFCPGAVQDVEGNIYGTAGIGTYCWMAENLNMGTRITGELDAQSDNDVTEKFCYDDDEDMCDEYGGLYEWDELMQYSTAAGTQGLCPDDWHVGTKGEWINMTSFLGGDYVAGQKLKSTTGWENNGNGTNESGFNALPGGTFWGEAGFDYMSKGEVAIFWLVCYYGNTGRVITDDDEVFQSDVPPDKGRSARCVKDNTMKK